MRSLGDTIRATRPSDMSPPDLEGLASTVISRTRAESAESWPGIFRRAQEDWHWVIVGSGAIAATLVSTAILSAILAFGPMPDRADSISAFYTNFRTPAGDLYLLATPAGLDQEPVLVRLNEDGALGSGGSSGPRGAGNVVCDPRACRGRPRRCASGCDDVSRADGGAEPHVAAAAAAGRIAAHGNQPCDRVPDRVRVPHRSPVWPCTSVTPIEASASSSKFDARRPLILPHRCRRSGGVLQEVRRPNHDLRRIGARPRSADS